MPPCAIIMLCDCAEPEPDRRLRFLPCHIQPEPARLRHSGAPAPAGAAVPPRRAPTVTLARPG